MIRYTLICRQAHEFESWFPSSGAYEAQARRGLVSCPVCGATEVERAVMAPNVARTDRMRAAEPPREAVSAAPAPASPAPPPAAPAALLGEREQELRRIIGELHRHVAETAEHVGPRFAEEALKIHHGESDARAIYGQASADEARMLHEEGVEFLPLPGLPEGRN